MWFGRVAKVVPCYTLNSGGIVQLKFGLDPNFTAIAVTGGPCGGKTSYMAIVRQYLEDRGFQVAILSEVATEFINAGLPPWAPFEDPLDFQKSLLGYSLFREDLYYSMLSRLSTDKPLVLLCDRGVLDARAYVTSGDYSQVTESVGVNLHHLRERYKAVVHLVTAADGAEEFYTLENNVARTESPEEARLLDQKTVQAWYGHQHLIVVDNRTGFEEKMTRALTALTRILGMPDPLEKERKFLVTNFQPSMIPSEAVKVEIEQTYLNSPSEDIERRVRKRTIDGTSSYYYAEKRPTGVAGVRVEKEPSITLGEYEQFLLEIDPATRTIFKDRYCFTEHGHHFELDVYADADFVSIEVEVEDMSLAITPPTGFELVEVTGDKKYSNKEIARIK